MLANEPSATEQAKPEVPPVRAGRIEPGDYKLDLSEVVEFPLHDNGQPSTFRDIYYKLRDAKILKMPDLFVWKYATFETDAGEVTVSDESGELNQSSVINLLCDLIDLEKDGIDAHRARWFYTGLGVSGALLYEFFVVHDEKIVRERFSCPDNYPRVLTKFKPVDHWRSEHEAWETYWYRKFYKETLTGQLMVLQPHRILYRYHRLGDDVSRGVEAVTLIKIYRLLLIAVPLLAGIAFPKLWPFMAVFAALVMFDSLWFWWRTRKIGR